ncbi:uncharacterized protein LOC101456487 [Ceratitis capitata]|uniref:uncharacterized protein LOC101456487 n=1 Tax=Ceratitis capitata TaxID=7213 RepID=UPI00032979BB|nr:uncharacterized protein LOC101456487 [Ceratitis capitata]
MALAASFLFLLQLFCILRASWAQRSPYSLQAAVEELHHREAAKYPLNSPPSQRYFTDSLGNSAEQDYGNNDLQFPSVFRERETQLGPVGSLASDHSTLTDQFLREIENAQEFEREEQYKEALRNLWEKYQQKENEIKVDMLNEKKRMRMPPYYMLMQKKSSYPVLPWLPYSERKKRFPVAKRSTKGLSTEIRNLGKTDDKVARDLGEIFGSPHNPSSDMKKKKRSTNEKALTSLNDVPSSTLSALNDTTTNAAVASDVHDLHQNGHANGNEVSKAGHQQKEHKHRKRSDRHSSHESHGEEDEGSESEEREEEEGEEEEEEEFDDEETEIRKRKRDLVFEKELLQSEPVLVSRLNNLRQKKSIDWSKYFGIDRKKKAVNGLSFHYKDSDASVDDEDLNAEKIDSMEKKLQSIEDFIIDGTIKYTGAHEGITDPDEIRRLKDHVLSRLATAYSLEKMRRALEKLRQLVDTENHLLHNVIDTGNNNEKRLSVKKQQAALQEFENIGIPENDKKKEIHSNAMMSTSSGGTTNIRTGSKGNDALDKVKKSEKTRNGFPRYSELPNEFGDVDDGNFVAPYETLNDAYLGNKNYIIGSNQCPLIEMIAERCREVVTLSGDVQQELLPICGVHQICYLCGSSQVACDYQYMTEADAICGNNNDCQAVARSVLMIIRGTFSEKLGPRECLRNSCLHGAMREIGL